MGLVSELRRRNVFRVAIAYMLVAWLILQVGDTLAPALRLPDWVNSAVAFFLILGFPLAVFFAWAYELTPEGLKLEKDVDRSQSVTHLTGRKLDYVIIGVLSAALLVLAFDKFVLDPARHPETKQATPEQASGPVAESGTTEVTDSKSIAVLPFVAISNGPDDEYFADGLSEEILNSLSQLPDLRVIARTSSFFFKGKDYPLLEIAERLGVAYVVEGSVRRSEETLRITAQLIRTSDVSQVWSKTYEDDRSNVLAVQTDVAEQVAAALGIVLDDDARERMGASRIDDVETFIAYQKGLEFYEIAHGPDLDMVEGLTIANTFFDKVIEAQPDLFSARVLRADRANHVLYRMILGAPEPPDIGEVKDVAQALQTELELAWRASPHGNQRDILDLERTLVSDDWTGLSSLIQRAMQEGSCPRMNITMALETLGFAEELARKLKESLACDPLDADVIFNLASALLSAGRPDEALELLDHAESAGVNAARFHAARINALIVDGRFDEPEVQGLLKSQLLTWNLLKGNQAEAQQMAERYWADPDTALYISFESAIMVGDRERANEIAARIDPYPGSGRSLLYFVRRPCLTWGRVAVAKGCRDLIPFDLDATPNFKARIEESGLPWPPLAFQDTSTDASR